MLTPTHNLLAGIAFDSFVYHDCNYFVLHKKNKLFEKILVLVREQSPPPSRQTRLIYSQ